jgi:hypothetical protein
LYEVVQDQARRAEGLHYIWRFITHHLSVIERFANPFQINHWPIMTPPNSLTDRKAAIDATLRFANGSTMMPTPL